MQELIQILSLTGFCILAVFSAYLFVVAIAGRFSAAYKPEISGKKLSIAVLIPAYRENAIILNTVKSAVAHPYPREKFRVFVAADQIEADIIRMMKEAGAIVLPVKFSNSTKAASLNALLNFIPENEFEIALILDADNVMEEGCLEQINSAFQDGFKGVQLHRIAKNNNNEYAIIDGVIEEVNNHLFRRGQQALGFSSHTIGSGMAFEFKKLKEIYNKPGITDNPACDREVDFEIMKSGIKIVFLDEGYVYDEKVSESGVFYRQRLRWLESHLFHLNLFRKEKVKFKGLEYWNRLFTVLIPPRVVFIVLFLFALILFITGKYTGLKLLLPPFGYWCLAMVLFLSAMLISLPTSGNFKISFKLLPALMIMAIHYIKAFFHIRPKRKEFIHTPKNYSKSPKEE